MPEILGKPRPIDERNRVILPQQVMELLKLKPKDEVYFKLNNGKITLGKALIKYEYIEEITTSRGKKKQG